MESTILIVALATVATVLVAVLIRSAAVAGKRRQQRWQEVAPALGLDYLGDDPSLIDTLSSFRLFQRGRRKRVRNVMRGSLAGADACLADYQYTTGGGKNSSTHRQTVLVVRFPDRDLPHVFLRREIPLIDSIGQLLGGQDIDFPEDAEFSKAFVLQGEDAEATRQLFDLDVRHAFQRLARTRLQLEARGDLLLYHEGRLTKPAEARELLQRASSALEALRAHS